MLASLAVSSGWRVALQGGRRALCRSRRRESSAWGVRASQDQLVSCRGSHRQCGVPCFAIPWNASLHRKLYCSKPCPSFKQEERLPQSTGERAAFQERDQPDAGDPGQRTAPPKGTETPSFSELYENPWTIPNLLSMTRIGLSPLLGCLIVEEDFNIALGIFALAGVTDLLDGYIARNWPNQKSVLGSALDPLADKILISVLYVCLTYTGLIPVPLTAMIVLRDIVLIAAVFYVRFKTLPPPKTVSRYFNPCYATAQLKPTFISKLNTGVQLILVAASLAAPVFNYVDSVYLQTLWCITAFTTAASAYSYYHYGRETVKILNK